MTAVSYSTLLLLTIVAAFAFGVAAAYWVICAFLNLFDPSRGAKTHATAPVLATTSSGD